MEYGITYDETMVFGDALNDYEMMQQVHCYAVVNAVDKIKEISNFEALLNVEQGILKILEEILVVHA